MRWRNYVLARDQLNPGSVEELWLAPARDDSYRLVVVGEGFDPRTCIALERFLETPVAGTTKVVGIDLVRDHEPLVTDASSRMVRDLAELHRERLPALCGEVGVQYEVLRYPRVNDSKAAGVRIARQIQQRADIQAVTHVIVDISALPAAVYFPLIAALVSLSDAREGMLDVQVVVCSNPGIDDAIVHEGVGEAGPIRGFSAKGADEDATVSLWAPVLGSRSGVALRTIHAEVDPDETCPVIPFPARTARRGDDILVSHRRFLFTQIGVEPGNFIHADERNPFDLYRSLVELKSRYESAVRPLGRLRMVLSSHSTKLLSLGVLLAAFEAELVVYDAVSRGYDLADDVDLATLARENSLTCLWIAGQPYL